MNNNDEMIKSMIAEKDKVKLKYKQKLNNIKQHYGIEFDIDNVNVSSIKNIRFRNLSYKNSLHDITLDYNNITKSFTHILYHYSDSRIVRTNDPKKMLSSLEKEYKLQVIIAEINHANEEYLREMNGIDLAYGRFEEDQLMLEKTMQLNKNEEN